MSPVVALELPPPDKGQRLGREACSSPSKNWARRHGTQEGEGGSTCLGRPSPESGPTTVVSVTGADGGLGRQKGPGVVPGSGPDY